MATARGACEKRLAARSAPDQPLERANELKALVARLWQHMDVLLVPTIGTTFTVDEVLSHLDAVVSEARAQGSMPSLPVGIDAG